MRPCHTRLPHRKDQRAPRDDARARGWRRVVNAVPTYVMLKRSRRARAPETLLRKMGGEDKGSIRIRCGGVRPSNADPPAGFGNVAEERKRGNGIKEQGHIRQVPMPAPRHLANVIFPEKGILCVSPGALISAGTDSHTVTNSALG